MRPIRCLRVGVLFAALAAAGCGTTEEPKKPTKSVRTARDLERQVQMRDEALMLFGRNDPAAWKEATAELRLLGEPLISPETMALAEQVLGPDASAAEAARMELYRRGQVPRILHGLESDQYEDWRSAKYAMLKLGEPGKEALVLACILQFQSERASHYEMARRMLVELGGVSLKFVAEAFDMTLRQPAGGASWSDDGGDERLPPTYAILREQCARTLAQLGREGQEALRKLAASPDERVRVAVAKGAASGDRAQAFTLLVDYLQRDASWRVRAEAAVGLGLLKDRRAVGPLLQALRDSDPFVRRKAAASLSIFEDERVVDALVDALADAPVPTFPKPGPGESGRGYGTLPGPDQAAMEHRIELVECLERLGNRRAIAPIFQALAAHPPALITPLYKAYDHALRTLTGVGGIQVRSAKEWRQQLGYHDR
ncbi:MAG: HEAT repeat domain-containing protein [Planctomycetes bacterium]|nr:HEAT repeat domain-containing protein [Planctomycetota bacterium]